MPPRWGWTNRRSRGNVWRVSSRVVAVATLVVLSLTIFYAVRLIPHLTPLRSGGHPHCVGLPPPPPLFTMPSLIA